MSNDGHNDNVGDKSFIIKENSSIYDQKPLNDCFYYILMKSLYYHIWIYDIKQAIKICKSQCIIEVGSNHKCSS